MKPKHKFPRQRAEHESHAIRAKKHLGQHFLRDESVANQIADALTGHNYDAVLEIGPGTGVLTKYLLKRADFQLFLSEVDTESIIYLRQHYGELNLLGDVLKSDVISSLPKPFAMIGNLPYNISSPIFFKLLEWHSHVPEMVCMVQKEVGQRICAPPGSKTYGLLSVLLQAFYTADYLFTVLPHVFVPPPKVDSAVIKLTSKNVKDLGCKQQDFVRVVKTAFNQRRKTLRNALKPLTDSVLPQFAEKRAETLSVADFVLLTNSIMVPDNLPPLEDNWTDES
ncbi:MAG: ribosomal RNA small subunit methyltransferase A [Cytophagales bacterium]|nr:MAG: ribosomal RNA small subunit methyltransferase A [Cytophagales bacterium]TAF61091.1 MAG: ribosomal RNA small subunit methyltransferase A [Cytophagales bacterium]